MSVGWVPLPVKTRQRLVCGVMCWGATHARHGHARHGHDRHAHDRHGHDITDSVRMMLPMATFLQLSDLDF